MDGRVIWRGWCIGAVLIGAISAGACASRPPRLGPVPIMGRADLSPLTLAAWFRDQTQMEYRASVPVETLAAYYIEEAAAEGVRGDLAFVQAVHETNWFAFTGVVPPSFNNFAGIGATDSGARPNEFPEARIGVRAQIQHLRAYADPEAHACAVPPLRYDCVDPRFQFVRPKGRARTWQQMGRGNWATDPEYAAKILALYQDLLRHAGRRRR